MSFDDLPAGWNTQPITPDVAPDVVDLFAKDADRVAGSLVLLLLDHDGVLLQPIVLSDIPRGAPPASVRNFLDQVGALVAEAEGWVILVRGRPGPASAASADRAWFSEARSALGPVLWGTYVASPHGIRQVGPAGVSQAA